MSHACGSTRERPAEAYPTRGNIKTIPWVFARNLLSWLKAQSFSNMPSASPPLCTITQHGVSRCTSASGSHDAATRFKRCCWRSNLYLLRPCFPQIQLPRTLRVCFKDSHLNFYFHSEMPCDPITTIITLSQKRQVALFGNWEEKNLRQKDLLTFYINKLEENNHASLGKKKNRDQQKYLMMGCMQYESIFV